MDGLAWILGLFMGASIGIGLAFLICALILNKSNNKGDSRLKPEDYSSEIMSFSDKDNMRHNFNEFTYLIDCNIEAMCRSNEYTFRNSKALPFGSKEPVSRYIPETNQNGEVVETVNAYREPVIFSSDSLSAASFHKGLTLGFGTSIETSKFGNYRTLSGKDATAMAYNSVSGATVKANPAANATMGTQAPMGMGANVPMGGVTAPMGGTTPPSGTVATMGGVPTAALLSGMMVDSSWAAARRQNMGADAWDRSKEVKIDPTASAGKPGRQMTQEEIDAFWNGGSVKKAEPASTAAPVAAAAPAAPVAPVAPAAVPAPVAPAPAAPAQTPFEYQTPASAPMDGFFPDPTLAAQNPAPVQPEPIYDAPTATRPLWENNNSNDDFSDFNDLM